MTISSVLIFADNDPAFDTDGVEIPVEAYNYRLFDNVIKYLTASTCS